MVPVTFGPVRPEMSSTYVTGVGPSQLSLAVGVPNAYGSRLSKMSIVTDDDGRFAKTGPVPSTDVL